MTLFFFGIIVISGFSVSGPFKAKFVLCVARLCALFMCHRVWCIFVFIESTFLLFVDVYKCEILVGGAQTSAVS